MSWLSKLIGKEDAKQGIYGAQVAAQDAAAKQEAILGQAGTESEALMRQGMTESDALVRQGMAPTETTLQKLMRMMSGEENIQLSSLARLQQAEAQRALGQQAAATGQFGSGRTMRIAGETAGNIAAQDAENQMARMLGLANTQNQLYGNAYGSMAQSRMSGLGSIAANKMSIAGARSGVQGDLGSTLGNAAIARGNLGAQSFRDILGAGATIGAAMIGAPVKPKVG